MLALFPNFPVTRVTTPAWPAWNVVDMCNALSNRLHGPKGVALSKLASEIYRISCLSNNAAPGQFPLPLDVIREFVAGGPIHSNYLAVGTLPLEMAVGSRRCTCALPHGGWS